MKDVQIDMELEADSNKETWKYYKTKYDKKLTINESHIYVYGNRLVCNFDYSQFESQKMLISVEKNLKQPKVMTLGGDCFFNFNEKKISMFRNIDTADEKTLSLDELSKMKHHANPNFTLIPVTGAMNNIKGKIHLSQEGLSYNFSKTRSFDRGDTFVYALDLFFSERNDIITRKVTDLGEIGTFLSHSILKESLKSENFKILYDFLNCFKTAEEYCSFFYGFTSEETQDVISQGKIAINSVDGIKNYIKFCEKIWNKISTI